MLVWLALLTTLRSREISFKQSTFLGRVGRLWICLVCVSPRLVFMEHLFTNCIPCQESASRSDEFRERMRVLPTHALLPSKQVFSLRSSHKKIPFLFYISLLCPLSSA